MSDLRIRKRRRSANYDLPSRGDILIPFLKVIEDGGNYDFSEINNRLAKYFGLSEEQVTLRHLDGKEAVFSVRTRTARLYLVKEGLVTKNDKGTFAITELGKKVLSNHSDELEEKMDREVEEFDPESVIGEKFNDIRRQLATELVEKVKRLNPSFLEKMVLDLLQAMGYGKGEVTGRTGDHGIDGYISEDKLGLTMIYYQAKRWEQPVDERELRDFVGALEIKGATKGIFITTSKFTKPTENYVRQLQQKKIVLIDGEKLGKLMIDYDIGVSVKEKYIVKRIDTDYFVDEF